MPFTGAMTALAEAGELPKGVAFTPVALAHGLEAENGDQSLDK